MLVKFQYVDWSEWSAPPERVHESPDKGVIRMYAIDDHGRQVEFVYDDFYYVYPRNGEWVFGSGTPKREFILRPGQDGADVHELPFTLPDTAVVRKGQTVSQDEAVKFGLIDTPDQKKLHEKRDVAIERCSTCG